jgi:hypothetical protein
VETEAERSDANAKLVSIVIGASKSGFKAPLNEIAMQPGGIDMSE